MVRRVASRVGQSLPKRSSSRAHAGIGHIDVTFCPFCGAILGTSFGNGSNCPACNQLVSWAASSPPGQALSSAEVKRALDEAVLSHAKRRYYVVRQTQDFVEMRKPKRLSPAWAAAWVVVGVPLPGLAVLYPVGYAIWHALKGETSIAIYVGPDGKLRTTQVGGTEG